MLFQVSDDGPGIASQELPHIFERFYRAPRGVQQRSEGTGLGLAISRAFVEAHGGKIWANAALDSSGTTSRTGTTISFTLPLAEAPLEQQMRTTLQASSEQALALRAELAAKEVSRTEQAKREPTKRSLWCDATCPPHTCRRG